MIERVLLAGVELPLADVFASVTIRHGRGSADEGPLASTATLSLVDVTRELVRSFSAGDELELLLADDVPRFRGRVSDGKLLDGDLEIIAVSSLSWLSARTIGLEDWPAEAWSSRVQRVFSEAGVLLRWEEADGAWADDPALTWAQPETNPRLAIAAGDDPALAARAASETTLGAYLGELIASHPAAIANAPDGSVIVQSLDSRSGLAYLELDPALVVLAPEWSQTDEVENAVTVEWSGGAAYDEDPASILRFDRRPQKITTELDVEADALSLAGERVVRRSRPRWTAAPIELLELEPAIMLGSPLRVGSLPDYAPAASALGVVEGWEDRIEPAEAPDTLEWSMQILLSDPRLSGVGVLWLSPSIAWQDAGAATWTDPEPLIE